MKLILNTDICKIFKDNGGHRMEVLTESGAWVELKELPGDLKGLVEALDISMNVLSGKFWIKGLVGPKAETKLIDGGKK